MAAQLVDLPLSRVMGAVVTMPPQSSASGSSAPASSTTPRPRVVALPRSLQELQQAAQLQFGAAQKLRFYHEGREMQHASSIAELRDGDTVSVRPDKPRRLAQVAERVLSTHQASYVRHAIEPPTKLSTPHGTSSIADSTPRKRLDGRSCYSMDYVPHTASPRVVIDREHVTATHLPRQAGALEASTTYASHYPWHRQKPTPPAGADHVSVLTDAVKGCAFTAQSSYSVDFAKPSRTEPPVKPVCTDTASTLTDWIFRQPFEGESCYAQNYVQHTLSGRLPSARPVGSWPQQSQAFSGTSEYTQKYVQKQQSSPTVHLKWEDS